MNEREAAILEQEMAAEQAYEMAAAFGPGADVVNVVTGERFRTPGVKPPQPVTAPPAGGWTVKRTISEEVKGYRENGTPIRSWDWQLLSPEGDVMLSFVKKADAIHAAAVYNREV